MSSASSEYHPPGSADLSRFRGNGERILVVDDVVDTRDFLVDLLRDHGYRTRGARTGHEAREWVMQDRPALILLDILLEDESGYEVCRKLRAVPEAKATPVIFISALRDIQDRTTGFQLGGADYIVKPFHPEEVLARVAGQIRIAQTGEQWRDMVAYQSKRLHQAYSRLSVLAHTKEASLRYVAESLLEPLEEACRTTGDLRQVDPIDPDYDDLVRALEGSLRQARFVVDEALLLGGLVQRPEHLQLGAFNLHHLVWKAFKDRPGEGNRRDIGFHEPPPTGMIWGEEVLYRVLVRYLVEIAQLLAESGSRVRCGWHCRQDGGHLTFEVVREGLRGNPERFFDDPAAWLEVGGERISGLFHQPFLAEKVAQMLGVGLRLRPGKPGRFVLDCRIPSEALEVDHASRGGVRPFGENPQRRPKASI